MINSIQVDIALISFNQEKYIAQAIESILMQCVDKPFKLRIIIADDCSTDKTLDIIQSYEEKSPFPFIYLKSESNIGHIYNYQRVFKKCDGEFLLVLEGDDYWSSPSHVSQHLLFLTKHKECSASINKLAINDQLCKYWRVRNNLTNQPVSYIDITQQIRYNHLGNHSACCYRVELLKQIPDIMYEKYFDDWILGMWLCQYGLIAQLDMVTSVYRIHKLGIYSGASVQDNIQKDVERLNFCKQILSENFHSIINESINNRRIKTAPKNSIYDWIPEILVVAIKLVFPKGVRRVIRKIFR